MGVISWKLFPACVNMYVCCPALRSRSRQPVKRYKKLLAEIFPKSPADSPNERKLRSSVNMLDYQPPLTREIMVIFEENSNPSDFSESEPYPSSIAAGNQGFSGEVVGGSSEWVLEGVWL
ncbi:hypothetical protein HanOQP8_Chr13g0472541 [Helianthus annuus]|nr:hypothetical protein HanLR1_Chr13g0473571 [Helianthus annuus]KAJ0670294.1 hypothetical protein HanOQP8_Chr13g0472541 [Helianthus annuus]